MRKPKQFGLLLLCTTLVALVFVACGGGDKNQPAETTTAAPPPAPAPQPAPAPAQTATAKLDGREGSGISGTVTFTDTADGVRVAATVSGLEVAGSHGFHIHQTGDCSAPDFTSAGGHFNPAGAIHGGPSDSEHHAGDLGNIEVGANGSGTLEATSKMLTFSGANSVLGKAVILHEGTDDFASQPTGAAGARLACGVITEG